MNKVKAFFASLGIFATILILIVVLIGAGLAIRWVVAPYVGKTEAREQTQGSGSYRIAAYESFFAECAAIQASEGRIKALEEERDATPPPDPARLVVINATLTAVKSSRTDMIVNYNAHTREENTRGQFRDDGRLPFTLYPEQEHTSCDAYQP